MSTVYQVVGKNSGKDVSITITDSNGRQYNAAQLGILTEFTVDTDYGLSETKSIINNGQSFFESLPRGSKAKLKFVRTNGALEDMESDYRKNSANGIQLSYTLQYQTKNRDGSINTRQLVECKPHNWSLGHYQAEQDVVQTVDFVSTGLNNTGTPSSLFA